MVDQLRTLTNLKTLLADNTTGNISPQDIRDAVVSLATPYAQCYQHNNASETVISVINTWTEVVLSTPTLTPVSTYSGSNDFDQPANGRIRYLGVPTRMFKIDVAISVESASNNKSFELAVGKNGIVDNASILHQRMTTGTDEQGLNLQLLTSLATNDYVSVFVKNTTDTSNITASHMNIVAISMLN